MQRHYHVTLEPVRVDAGTLTPAEVAALQSLRDRYRETGDVFSARELARLRFLRRCYASGRLPVDAGAER